MTPYKNLQGDSGIESYEMTDDSLTVKFKSGQFRHYLYTNKKPGPAALERMKQLAIQGKGLNGYILTIIKDRFSDRW